jgi:transcriptional regulator GlxA family with amidase domain
MDQRVHAAIIFMKTNLHRNLTPIEIAQSVRLSPSRLRELFRNQTGISLKLYRRELRLERAKHLLETTFLSVKEVAASVGIHGLSHFVRDFERAYQMTPARYAERHRKATHKPRPLGQ